MSVNSEIDDEPIMAYDMLQQIGEWLSYVQTELDQGRIDLVELNEIERVYHITTERE